MIRAGESPGHKEAYGCYCPNTRLGCNRNRFGHAANNLNDAAAPSGQQSNNRPPVLAPLVKVLAAALVSWSVRLVPIITFFGGCYGLHTKIVTAIEILDIIGDTILYSPTDAM